MHDLINRAVLHLHPSKIKECIDFIASDARLCRAASNNKVNPVKIALRRYLGLDKLPRGTSTPAKQFWVLRGWSEDEAAEKIRQQTSKINYKSFSPFSKHNKKYEGLSPSEIDDRIKSVRPNRIEFYIHKGYSPEEARQKVFEFQQRAGIEGNKSYSGDRNPAQLAYWLKSGFTLEQAKKRLALWQNKIGLGSCIERLGLFRGVLHHLRFSNDRNKSKRRAKVRALWQCRKLNCADMEIYFYYLDIFEKEEILKTKGHASRESLLFFFPFYEILSQSFTCHLGIHPGKNEFKLKRKNGKHFRYDFCIEELKLIFEYDGLFFHGEKSHFKYSRQFEKEKIELAEQHGYSVVKLDGLKNKQDFSAGYNNFHKIINTLAKKDVIISLLDISSKFLLKCKLYDASKKD
jgi:very-short-patch-repair endonuclease